MEDSPGLDVGDGALDDLEGSIPSSSPEAPGAATSCMDPG